MKSLSLPLPNLPLPDLVAFNARVHRRLDPWCERRWVRRLAIAAAAFFLLGAGMWVYFATGLPTAQTLLAYEPPLPTKVRSYDGDPVQTFARERRVNLTYDEYPPVVVQAFISAEDKTFFRHGGLDYPGLLGAVGEYVAKTATGGGRSRGGSTITQQVAKALLQDSSYSIGRKAREAILAFRLESVLSKEEILALYLNQSFLGRNAYGVQAASRAYFDKDVGDLTLSEAAYLAVLPKAPANYDPIRATQRALDRRNYVLREMYRNGYITEPQWRQAAAMPLGTIRYGGGEKFRDMGGYFMEDVRRELIRRFGETAEDGRNSVYAGGLWVRTSVVPVMQDAARKRFAKPWRTSTAAAAGGTWSSTSTPMATGPAQLDRTPVGTGFPDWRKAVVLSKSGSSAQIGFTNGTTGDAARLGRLAAQARGRRLGVQPLPPGHDHHRQAAGRRQLRVALDPADRRRFPGRGGQHRPDPGDAGRLRRDRVELQSRDPGASPAGIGVQADRLRSRAGKRHDPGVDHRRCALLRLAGRGARQQMLRQLRPPLFRPEDDALGRRAVAQPDDRPRRLAGRHGQGHRRGAPAGRRRL